VAGVVAVTVVYAGLHGLRRVRLDGAVDMWSGLAYTEALLGRVVAPVNLMPLFGLMLLGFLLAAARLASGALWLPIGIHAAWVAVFRVGRLFLDIRPSRAGSSERAGHRSSAARRGSSRQRSAPCSSRATRPARRAFMIPSAVQDGGLYVGGETAWRE
jgi:hypothetical protein